MRCNHIHVELIFINTTKPFSALKIIWFIIAYYFPAAWLTMCGYEIFVFFCIKSAQMFSDDSQSQVSFQDMCTDCRRAISHIILYISGAGLVWHRMLLTPSNVANFYWNWWWSMILLAIGVESNLFTLHTDAMRWTSYYHTKQYSLYRIIQHIAISYHALITSIPHKINGEECGLILFIEFTSSMMGDSQKIIYNHRLIFGRYYSIRCWMEDCKETNESITSWPAGHGK